MAQRRSEKVLVYLEPILYSALINLTKQTGVSYSEHVHKLIIADLKARGILTDSMIVEHLC